MRSAIRLPLSLSTGPDESSLSQTAVCFIYPEFPGGSQKDLHSERCDGARKLLLSQINPSCALFSKIRRVNCFLVYVSSAAIYQNLLGGVRYVNCIDQNGKTGQGNYLKNVRIIRVVLRNSCQWSNIFSRFISVNDTEKVIDWV